MKSLHQKLNASLGECLDVQFKNRSTPIKLPPQYMREGVIESGWKMTIEHQNDYNQVWISEQIVSTMI